MAGPAVIEIADPQDAALDPYRHLRDADARRAVEAAHGLFVIEGVTVIRRLLTSRYPIRSLLLLPATFAALRPDLEDHEVTVLVADRDVLALVAGFDVHRGALAVAERLDLPDPDLLVRGARAVAVLEGVNDHENLGAIARSAGALGVDALLLDPTCADPLYRRSVRVSMGELLFLPWTRLEPWPDGLALPGRHAMVVVALTPAADAESLEAVLDDVAGRPVALLLGAEGPGLSRAAMQHADRRARIPLQDSRDSLNVGHAAAIAFHAVARRR
jgi:tRNA G18 (ribose-2'-O)-methylase SpoU